MKNATVKHTMLLCFLLFLLQIPFVTSSTRLRGQEGEIRPEDAQKLLTDKTSNDGDFLSSWIEDTVDGDGAPAPAPGVGANRELFLIGDINRDDHRSTPCYNDVDGKGKEHAAIWCMGKDYLGLYGEYMDQTTCKDEHQGKTSFFCNDKKIPLGHSKCKIESVTKDFCDQKVYIGPDAYRKLDCGYSYYSYFCRPWPAPYADLWSPCLNHDDAKAYGLNDRDELAQVWCKEKIFRSGLTGNWHECDWFLGTYALECTAY